MALELLIIKQQSHGNWIEVESFSLTEDHLEIAQKRAKAHSVLMPKSEFQLIIVSSDTKDFGISRPYSDYQPEFESRFKYLAGEQLGNF